MDKDDTTVNPGLEAAPKSIGIFIKRSIGYAIAILGAIWAFHDIQFGRFLQEISSIAWLWVLLAILCDILSYICQGIRWKFVLKPLGRISVIKSTQAIYAGLYTNEILPLRFGEMVRAFLVSRWLGIRLTNVISSIAVERLYDIIWLSIAVGLAVMSVPLPHTLNQAANILGIIASMSVGIFIFLVFFRRDVIEPDKPLKASRWKIWAFLQSSLGDIFRGIRQIGLSKSLYSGFAVSAFILIFQILAFWLVMKGFGLSLSLWIGAVVLIIVHLGTSIPNAPSNLGSYQFFTVLALSIFNVDKTSAAGFSVVVFVVLTIPLWILGILAIGRSGMTLQGIKKALSRKEPEAARTGLS